MKWNQILKFFGAKKMEWQKFDTESGAPFWFLRMPGVRNTSCGVLDNRGSRDEVWPEEAGGLHALEHMFFEGTTKSFPSQKEVSEYIEEVGGYDNAYTAEEETFYFHKISTREIERSIKVLGESLFYPLFPDAVIPAQMDVILHELKGGEDNAYRFLSERWTASRLAGHQLSQNPIGLAESIKGFRREDFLKFSREYYNPSNFIYLAVSGGEPENILFLINKYFPKVVWANKKTRVKQPIPQKPSSNLILEKDIQETVVLSGVVFDKLSRDQAMVSKIFSLMIGGGASFPLFQEVRWKRGLCYEIWANSSEFSDAVDFKIMMGTDRGAWESALDSAFKVIEESKNSEVLLMKAKKLMRGRLDLSDSTSGFLHVGAQSASLYGEPQNPEEALLLYEAIKIEDVEDFVNTFLKRENFYTGVLLPK